ncbi:hypothetical protein HU200_003747 [Digitaria exilis]|uniref:Uncharacterized protein n=1 Tax=Digitaria exilis TaxID=1010633 RepID=A0A835KUD8_9POAL|nr:hypothetical protein HU200_003747 [Digitaria exilis]
MEKKKKKKKEAALAVLKGKAAVKVAPKAKQVIILSDDDDDVKEENSSSDEEYGEEGDSVDKNSDDVKDGEVEEPAVVEEADDGDERAIVRVRKFEGSTILAEVDRTEDNGVTSRTGRRKVRKLQKSQLVHGKEDYAKGTL